MKNLKPYITPTVPINEKKTSDIDFDYDIELLSFWSELSPHWHYQQKISSLGKDEG